MPTRARIDAAIDPLGLAAPVGVRPRENAAPVSERGRIRDLDIIRGGALIGVMWMNVYAITIWLVPARARDVWATAPLDHVAAFLSDWLVGGKAQTLFGILFGFGFAVFTERAVARDDDATRLYARRLFFLFALGMLHLTFLWWGDILHDYAPIGILLLVTRRWSDNALLAMAICLGVVAPPLLHATLVTHHQLTLLRVQFHTVMGNAVHAGHYLAAVHAVETRVLAVYGAGGGYSITSTIAGQFLFGAWLHRRDWLQRADAHRTLFSRLAISTLPVGLLLAVLSPLHDLLPRFGRSLDGVFPVIDTVAIPTLAIGWASVLVVAGRLARLRPALGALAAFGRMALTNYVAQSVFFLAVPDGFGIDLAWRAGLTVNLVVALAFVALQVAGSAWWLRHFRFGPLEWLWRCATYGRWQSFRRVSPA